MANPWDNDPVVSVAAAPSPWDSDPEVGGKSSVAGDILKSLGAGVARGTADLIGLPGTIENAFDRSISGITGFKAPPPSLLSGEMLSKGMSAVTGGATDYAPQTIAGQYAHTAGEFIPGAVLGPESVAANIVKYGLIPAATSETAGQVASRYAPSVEPYARFAGALAGGMLPSAFRALVPTAQDSALSEIAKAAVADGMTPAAMRQRLAELGPDSMVADLGPNFQGQTGALANLPGESNEIIRTALNDRNAGANTRLAAALDQLSPRVVPSEVQAGIADNMATVGDQYGPVMQGATAVDAQPLANTLDAARINLRGPGQQAVDRVRGYLNIPGVNLNGAPVLDPNPNALFQTRQAIDGLLADETNPQVVRQLTMARAQVDQELAQAAPGIKDVDAQYAELARQGEALGEGQRVLDSGRTAPRPEELAQRVQEGALPQGTQIGPSAVPLRLSQGARADIDRIVGNNTNDIVAMNRLIKGEGDWNRAKLVTLFGQERADQLLNVLSNEQAYANTRNFATGNSLSANRLQYQRAYSGGEGGMTIPEYYGTGGILGALRGAGVKVAEKLASTFMDSRNEARNTEIARNLTGRDAVVAALVQRQLQGSRLTGPAKAALVNALLDQRRRLEDQSNTRKPSRQ